MAFTQTGKITEGQVVKGAECNVRYAACEVLGGKSGAEASRSLGMGVYLKKAELPSLYVGAQDTACPRTV